MSFSNKVVIVTGANSGIGYATADLFDKLGATLIAIDKETNSINALSQKSKRVTVLKLDLRDEDVVRTELSNTIKETRQLDVLVNAAGIIRFGGIFETTREQIDSMLTTALKALHNITQWALPYLILSQGNVVNVSDRYSIKPAKDLMAYSVAMATVDQFTRCLALDMAGMKVRANCVNPGTIDRTGLYKNAGMTNEQFNCYKKQTSFNHPLGRLGVPSEVAKTIVFLASSHASFITGVTLPVDGGASIQNFP